MHEERGHPNPLDFQGGYSPVSPGHLHMATPMAVKVPTLLLLRSTKSRNTVCELLFLTFVSTKSQTQHTFVAITMEIGWFRIRQKLFVSFAIFIVF